jgi:hypothetical protein
LAIDQARKGAWSIFDNDAKRLERYGTFHFPGKKCRFSKATLQITALVDGLLKADPDIRAVFIEDIQLRVNVNGFKLLAQLRGALINLFEGAGVPYGSVYPAKWQAFCGANVKGRTKELSKAFARDMFGVDTDDDNLSDAICIGWYVVNDFDWDKLET